MLNRLATSFTICLVRDGKLTRVTRTENSYGAVPLHRVLVTQFNGVSGLESSLGFSSPLPSWLSSGEILGLARSSDTLIINLSSAAADAMRNSLTEQLACYSLVTTLLDATGLNRVAFLFNGEAAGTLGGSIWWGGHFMYAPGLMSN